MVADFDEQAGDYPAAIRTLEAAIATNEELLGGFTGVLQARLGWVLLHDGQLERAETVYRSALEAARRVRHTMALFQAQAGLAALHRFQGRDGDAVDAATEALALYDAHGFPRFRNRIDPTADLRACAALCCDVLAVIAAERADQGQAAMLLRRADGLRDGPYIAVPSLLQHDIARARTSTSAEVGDEALHSH